MFHKTTLRVWHLGALVFTFSILFLLHSLFLLLFLQHILSSECTVFCIQFFTDDGSCIVAETFEFLFKLYFLARVDFTVFGCDINCYLACSVL